MSPVARTLWLALLAVSAVSLVSGAEWFLWAGHRAQPASFLPPRPHAVRLHAARYPAEGLHAVGHASRSGIATVPPHPAPAGRRLQRVSVPPPSPPQQLAVLPSSALANDTLLDDSEGAGTVELKIINGEQAPVGQFGFMVALLQQGRFFCGGTLLDANTVLTGAPGPLSQRRAAAT